MQHSQRSLYLPRGLASLALTAVICWLAALGGAVASAAQSPPPSGLANHMGGVHGSLYVAGPPGLNGRRPHYPVPGHVVELRDKVTNALVATTAADVYSRYYFPPQPLGTYRLKWVSQGGLQAGEYPHDIVVAQGTVNPEWIELKPLRRYSLIVGKVTLRDGSVPGVVDEFFGVERTPEVSLVTSAGVLVAGPVRAGADGRYALSAAIRGDVIVRARLEGSTAQAPAGPSLRTALVRDLVLPNTAPIVAEMYLENAAGRGVRGEVAGQMLRSVADLVDPDSDPLSITWKTEYPSAQPFLTQSGNVAEWSLPNVVGTHKIYGLISDGRGAYVRRSLSATINKTRERFTGTVLDRTSGQPIAGARVEVNGLFADSNAEGFYSLEVPLAERYVLNVRERDHALAGRVFDTGNMGRVWRLVRRQREMFDANVGITLVDRRPELGQERRGATLTLPPGLLVDPQGNPATGLLSASFATIDIASDESAGDYIAEENGRLTGLVSYGVISVEITDALGQKYQVRPGGRALLNVPIVGADVGSVPSGAPNNIAIWSYDEVEGLWQRSGDATLDPSTSSYVGTVNHFSEINVDAPGSDTCIRVLVDPSLLGGGRHLRVSDVSGDGIDYPAVLEGPIDRPLSVLYTIPPGQLVRLEVIDGPGGTPLTGILIERFESANPGAGWINLPGNEVLSGPVSTPTFPAYPYSECPVSVTLKRTAPPADSFLTKKGLGSAALALDYYAQADLPGARTTLQDWWAHNGFAVDGSKVPTGSEAYARTSYLNDNDLGSGRDMHLYRRSDGTVAAWVTNYGQFDQSHGNADLAFNQTAGGATVCMESAPMENVLGQYIDSGGAFIDPGAFGSPALYHAAVEAASVVKFFVYADADALPGDELQPVADLDEFGPKAVPNLCLNCHGGSASPAYTVPSDCYTNAFLRELDYDTYKFPGGATGPNLAQRQAFRVQNDIVRSTNTSPTSNSPIKQLIDIWYRDGAGDVDQDDCLESSPGVFVPASLPPGWLNANPLYAPFYRDVVAESCRTCHIAFTGFSFNSDGLFLNGGFLESALTDFINNTPGTGTMPHAIITYRNFWLSTSPFRPQASLDFFAGN